MFRITPGRLAWSAGVLLFLGVAFVYEVLFKRIPPMRHGCAGINARITMYRDYHENDCPAVKHLNPDESCGGWSSWIENQCIPFCQIRKCLFSLALCLHRENFIADVKILRLVLRVGSRVPLSQLRVPLAHHVFPLRERLGQLELGRHRLPRDRVWPQVGNQRGLW